MLKIDSNLYCKFFLSRIVLVLSQPLTLFVTARFLEPKDVGLYYAFVGIVASVSIFELGYGVVLTNLVNHECATDKIKDSSETQVSDLEQILAYTKIRFSRVRKIYIWVSISLSLLYLTVTRNLSATNALILCGSCFLNSLTLLYYPILCIAEGKMRISEVQYIRVAQSVAVGISYAVVVVGCQSLWAFLVSQTIGVTVLRYLVKIKFPEIDHEYNSPAIDGLVANRKIAELVKKYSNQTAVSWIAGYISNQALVPLILLYHGPIIAGKLGLVNSLLQVMLAFASLNSAIIAPQAASLIHGVESSALLIAIRRQILFAWVKLSLMIVCVAVLLATDNRFSNMLDKKLLGLSETILWLATGFGSLAVTFWAVLLRGLRSEPYFFHSIVGAIIGFIVINASGVYQRFDVFVYLIVFSRLVVLVPWHYYSYTKKIRAIAR
jgi:hypothetical protein